TRSRADGTRPRASRSGPRRRSPRRAQRPTGPSRATAGLPRACADPAGRGPARAASPAGCSPPPAPGRPRRREAPRARSSTLPRRPGRAAVAPPRRPGSGARAAGCLLAGPRRLPRLDRRLRRGQPRNRHAERRAGDVVEPGRVAEAHARRIAGVLAADADLEIRPGRAAALDADPDQRADALDVDRDEGVLLQDPGLEVVGQELAGVVAREAVAHLGQVVGAE